MTLFFRLGSSRTQRGTKWYKTTALAGKRTTKPIGGVIYQYLFKNMWLVKGKENSLARYIPWFIDFYQRNIVRYFEFEKKIQTREYHCIILFQI